eukprot:m.154182 g.154182  ORF g.154182 m.154182 type:complete len:301 (+) comp30875_c0_seq1:120-1022(+)
MAFTSTQVAVTSVVSAGVGALLSWQLFRASTKVAASVTTAAVNSDAFKLSTPSPRPDWKPRDPQPAPWPTPKDGSSPFHSSTPQDLKSPYFFAISAVVPRPIAFVGTVSKDGVKNLSPFSYFGLMGHDPFTLAVTFCSNRGPLPDKDSLTNLRETGECTVQIMSSWFVEAANHTCGNWDAWEDEFELSGLTPLASTVINAPRVGEAGISFECKLISIRPMENDNGDVKANMALLKVVMVHVNKNIYDETTGAVKLEELDPISRMGGNTYSHSRLTFDVARPGKSGEERAKAMAAAAALSK